MQSPFGTPSRGSNTPFSTPLRGTSSILEAFYPSSLPQELILDQHTQPVMEGLGIFEDSLSTLSSLDPQSPTVPEQEEIVSTPQLDDHSNSQPSPSQPWNEHPPWQNINDGGVEKESGVIVSNTNKPNQHETPIKLTEYTSDIRTSLEVNDQEPPQSTQQQLKQPECHSSQQSLLPSVQSTGDITEGKSESALNPSDTNTLFEMMGALTEKIKDISTATSLIPTLQSDIKDMATQISSLKADLGNQVANLNGRVLSVEEDIESLKKTITTNNSYVNTRVKPVIKKLEKDDLLGCLSTNVVNKISANEAAILELQSKIVDLNALESLNKTVSYGLSDTEIESVARYVHDLNKNEETGSNNTENRFEKLDNEMQTLRHTVEQLQRNNTTPTTNNRNTGNSSTTRPKQQPTRGQKAPDVNKTLDYDTIIIGDSNTKRLDMLTLGRGTRKRYTCYTIPHIKDFVNTATIKRQPNKVMIHVGTNDVERESDEQQLKRDFVDLIHLLRKVFPNARIFFSSIFVRREKEDPLNKVINNLNVELEAFCDVTPKFTLLDNSDISHMDMADTKHLNPTGLHAFVCNIWKVVFGEQYKPRRRGRGR